MSLFEPANSRRDLAGSMTLSLAWLAITAFGLFLKPDPHGHGTHQELGLPPCPSVVLFDRPCPGCGLTTSWTALLHGDFALAFHAHALGPILYLGYAAFALTNFWLFFRTMRWREGRWINPALATVFGVFVGYGAIRMATTPHYAMEKERLIRAIAAQK